MKAGDLVNITQARGAGGSAYENVPRGWGLVLEIIKTPDVTYGSIGPFNLGDDVAVQLLSGKVEVFCARSLEVISD